MLSICIPVFNVDVRELVTALLEQRQKLTEAIEVVLIDDCSKAEFKKVNEALKTHCTYIELAENIGRARIRNLFLGHTHSENLLFLDCDSLIVDEHFLANYISALKTTEHRVIFGGRIYPKKSPSLNQQLSWVYGTYRESKSVSERVLHPNKSFMTNNFVIKRSVLENCRFDERLYRYGHEDTLFGIELLRNNVFIHHINNPVLNGDIETNEEYLNKTENGIKNLIFIESYYEDKALFIQNVNILRTYVSLRKYGLHLLAKIAYKLLKKGIKTRLLKGSISLRQFDLYKLGYYMEHKNA